MKNINKQFEEIEFDDFGEIIDQKTLKKAILAGALCACVILLALVGITYLIIQLWHN